MIQTSPNLSKSSQVDSAIAPVDAMPIDANRDRWATIRHQIHAATNEQMVFESALQAIHQTVSCDRVLLYQFRQPFHGVVMAEVCTSGWTPMLHADLPPLCFGAEVQTLFTQAVEIQGSEPERHSLTPYQQQLLEHYQIQRSLAFPIIRDGRIWGLLVIQRCAQTQTWTLAERMLVEQMSTELPIKLEVLALQAQVQQQAQYAKATTQMTTTLLEHIQQSNADATQAAIESTLQALQNLLKVDRVAIYTLAVEGRDQFTYESRSPDYPSWIGLDIPQSWQAAYRDYLSACQPHQVITWVLPSLPPDSLGADQAVFQIETTAIAPIVRDKQIWGFLGAYQSRSPKQWTELDQSCLAQISAQIGLGLQQATERQAAQRQKDKLEQTLAQEATVMRIVDRIHKSHTLETILEVTVQDLRQLLKVDRVFIYRFNLDGSGTFMAESLSSGWRALLGTALDARMGSCQVMSQVRPTTMTRTNYESRLYTPALAVTPATPVHEFCVEDIHTSTLDPVFLEQLESLGARSYYLSPLWVGNRLWGLLGAYHHASERIWPASDRKRVQQVGTQLAIAIQQAEHTEQLAQAAEHEKVLSRIYNKIRRSLDITAVFNTTAQEVRQILNGDRAVIYQFNADWSGQFVAESVASGWQSVLQHSLSADLMKCPNLTRLQTEGENFVDAPDFPSGRRVQGGFCVDDIYDMDFPTGYLEALESLSARAYLITALFLDNKLWGLLAVYQNTGPRTWAVHEAKLLDKIGAQFSAALQQAVALEKVQSQSWLLTEAAERERTAKENLQHHAIQVLMSVRPTFEGDLTVRAPITEDEIGTIADAYNNTLQSLRKIVMQVQHSTENLNETSNQSEQAISNLARQAQFQFQALLRTLDQIQNLSDQAAAVNQNALQVEQAVQRANETVQVGDFAMNRTVDGILVIRETVAETGKKIKRLSESSQKISRVVNVISNFTAQTQLLALNASIEATRAGEYGRGFSVVADEVRSLARQSATATTEIEKLVQEIQREMIEVSAAMEKGIEQVANGTNLVNETRQSLNAIVSATAQISQLVVGITQAATEQTEQSQSLAETMAELAMTANQTSEDAVQISTSFQTLLSMAENLQTSVGQFKVN